MHIIETIKAILNMSLSFIKTNLNFKMPTKFKLTYSTKKEIIDFSEKNPNMSVLNIVSYFNSKLGLKMARTTVYGILQNKDKIKNMNLNELQRSKTSKYSFIEEDLANFILNVQKNCVPINFDILKKHTSHLMNLSNSKENPITSEKNFRQLYKRIFKEE